MLGQQRFLAEPGFGWGGVRVFNFRCGDILDRQQLGIFNFDFPVEVVRGKTRIFLFKLEIGERFRRFFGGHGQERVQTSLQFRRYRQHVLPGSHLIHHIQEFFLGGDHGCKEGGIRQQLTGYYCAVNRFQFLGEVAHIRQVCLAGAFAEGLQFGHQWRQLVAQRFRQLAPIGEQAVRVEQQTHLLGHKNRQQARIYRFVFTFITNFTQVN